MNGKCLALRKEKAQHAVFVGTLSNIEKIISAILPLASSILFTLLPFRLFSNLFSVTMLALLLRISSKIAQKCRCKIAGPILSTLLNIKCVADDFSNVVDLLEGVEHIDVHHVFGLFIEGLTRL